MPNEPADKSITFKCTTELHDAIVAAANEADRSVASFCRIALVQRLRNYGKDVPAGAAVEPAAKAASVQTE